MLGLVFASEAVLNWLCYALSGHNNNDYHYKHHRCVKSIVPIKCTD